jgi:hypothetical protein
MIWLPQVEKAQQSVTSTREECNKSTYIISLGGRPFHPSVPSSIHPSSSSPKKKTMADFTVSEGHGYPLVWYDCRR